MNRYGLLLRRHLSARRLGFTFVGTTHSKLPLKAKLGGRVITLTYPSDSGYMSDVINLWLDDEYGIQQTQFEPTTVVDIGGNIGLFSLWVWNHFPNSHIYTFEPNPRVFEFLSMNLSPTNAQAFRVGISCEPGRAELIDNSSSRIASTTLRDNGEIELISLSKVVEIVGGSIDLLKIDCEGAEWEIFRDKDAFQSIRTIRMEYHLHGLHSVDSLKTVTKGLGYRMTHHSPNRGYGIAWFEKK